MLHFPQRTSPHGSSILIVPRRNGRQVIRYVPAKVFGTCKQPAHGTKSSMCKWRLLGVLLTGLAVPNRSNTGGERSRIQRRGLHAEWRQNFFLQVFTVRRSRSCSNNSSQQSESVIGVFIGCVRRCRERQTPLQPGRQGFIGGGELPISPRVVFRKSRPMRQ